MEPTISPPNKAEPRTIKIRANMQCQIRNPLLRLPRLQQQILLQLGQRLTLILNSIVLSSFYPPFLLNSLMKEFSKDKLPKVSY